jgi:hypothetical protein
MESQDSLDEQLARWRANREGWRREVRNYLPTERDKQILDERVLNAANKYSAVQTPNSMTQTSSSIAEPIVKSKMLAESQKKIYSN